MSLGRSVTVARLARCALKKPITTLNYRWRLGQWARRTTTGPGPGASCVQHPRAPGSTTSQILPWLVRTAEQRRGVVLVCLVMVLGGWLGLNLAVFLLLYASSARLRTAQSRSAPKLH